MPVAVLCVMSNCQTHHCAINIYQTNRLFRRFSSAPLDVIHAYMKVCSLYCRKKFKTRVSGLICNFSVFGFQTLDVAVLNYLFILNSFYFFPKFFFHFFPIYERKSIGSRQGSSQSLIICLRVNFP